MLDSILPVRLSAPPATLSPPPQKASHAAIHAAAMEYESIFLAQLLQPIFDTLPKDGFFHGGHAEDIFQDMLVQEYGKMMAENGGIGMADAIAKELLALQEMS